MEYITAAYALVLTKSRSLPKTWARIIISSLLETRANRFVSQLPNFSKNTIVKISKLKEPKCVWLTLWFYCHFSFIDFVFLSFFFCSIYEKFWSYYYSFVKQSHILMNFKPDSSSYRISNGLIMTKLLNLFQVAIRVWKHHQCLNIIYVFI